MCAGPEKGAGFQRVTLLGLGAMGASLGLALKRLNSPPRVIGYSRRAATRAAAERLGAADRIADDPRAAVEGADLVIGCLPIMALPDAFREILTALTDGAVLTDVGSTKAWLAGKMRDLMSGAGGNVCVYIGSHPMTGTERSGPEAARAGLYDGAAVFLTPRHEDDPAAVARLRRFWEAAGARVFLTTPAEHDRCVARTSHLPHLAAAALAAAALRDSSGEIAPFIGPGFRDSTRVAGGPADVWHDIVRTNSAALLEELEVFGKTVEGLRERIRAGDFEEVRDFLESSRMRRAAILERPCDR